MALRGTSGREGHRGASASTSTRRSTWRISTEFPLPSGRGRADRCRLHHRAAREVGGQQPRQEADLRHRRQRPLSSRPCGPAVAGETRLPHHSRLPARPCTPSQRHREVRGCHAPRSDPRQVPCELQTLRRSHLRFLSPTNATRVDKMARPSPIISGSYPIRTFGFWSELGIYTPTHWEVEKVLASSVVMDSCWEHGSRWILSTTERAELIELARDGLVEHRLARRGVAMRSCCWIGG